ncbi:Ribonuclease Rh [Zancudomyces culisetae]|uniref:ribonuclease T2 n=1 Tax=Zancudomyces culisetae TaxID=1213189 RepID=A0A1R1PN64_ZANCU|nr:Ribonuclease Rh [Zancudomyces culisetae]|eukprot:OMH82406.1 Ribonuclease Rh [Zancudomyces culisetae]
MSRLISGNILIALLVFFSVYFCLGHVLEPQYGLNEELTQEAVDTDSTCPNNVMSCTRTDVNSCCSPKYGLLVLSLQWDLHHGPSEKFTIHGLWPSRCDKERTPKNGCDSSRTVDKVDDIIMNLNRTLYSEMKSLWPSNKGNDNKFWVHEWNKHGTCVTTLDPNCYDKDKYANGTDKIDYFATVVELSKKYNVYEYLKKHDIVPVPRETNGNPPTKRYKPEEFIGAIEAEFGFKPSLTCGRGGKLMEVRLFFHVKNKDVYMPMDSVGGWLCLLLFSE